jgi:hypothetical protein
MTRKRPGADERFEPTKRGPVRERLPSPRRSRCLVTPPSSPGWPSSACRPARCCRPRPRRCTINDGQAPAQHIVGQAITTGGGDVVSGGGYQLPTLAGTGVNAPPDFPTNTTSLPRPGASNSDGGFDIGVLVALGVGILVALGAWFLVVATKRRTRERQAV